MLKPVSGAGDQAVSRIRRYVVELPVYPEARPALSDYTIDTWT